MKMIIGKYYLTLCLVREGMYARIFNWNNEFDDQEMWMDTIEKYVANLPLLTHQYERYQYIIPLINHPHNDIENGQKEIHYHRDDRFEAISSDDSLSHLNYRIDLPLQGDETLQYVHMKYINDTVISITPKEYIAKSKLKHQCIHKGKCPHRGYDLSNEVPINGVITCPLHGLKFNSETKQLIK